MNEQLTLEPVARATDPETAHAAARTVQPANSALIAAIRKALIEGGPQNAWEIAYAVEDAHGDRWAIDTIRTAVARVPGIRKLHFESTSPRGNRCSVYEIVTETIDPGDRL